jgi:hypothetical protein
MEMEKKKKPSVWIGTTAAVAAARADSLRRHQFNFDAAVVSATSLAMSAAISRGFLRALLPLMRVLASSAGFSWPLGRHSHTEAGTHCMSIYCNVLHEPLVNNAVGRGGRGRRPGGGRTQAKAIDLQCLAKTAPARGCPD